MASIAFLIGGAIIDALAFLSSSLSKSERKRCDKLWKVCNELK